MTPEQQGKKWLRLWTEVANRVQETGGSCFVIVKGTGPGPDNFVIEGNAQEGEVRAAAPTVWMPTRPSHRTRSTGAWRSDRVC
jgi:hypothetical protein